MPRPFRLLASVLIALWATAAVAATGSMSVELKQSRRIMLGGQIGDVVVADPSVADVTVIDSHSVILLGKGYGTTDVLVLDHAGRTLLNSRVTVVEPQGQRLSYFPGPSLRAEFSCTPRCEPIRDNASQGGSTPSGQ
jgi:Flp pilus assembly secretin CpaC